MKVYELASDLEVESSQVLATCETLDLGITSHMQNLTDEQADAVTDKLAKAEGETKEVDEGDSSVVDDALADEVEAEAGDMTGVTEEMLGVEDGEEYEEEKAPPAPTPVVKLKEEDVRVLAENVNDFDDVGFDALYDNIEQLVMMYPGRNQFPLAQDARSRGKHELGRQAMRNGLLEIKPE